MDAWFLSASGLPVSCPSEIGGIFSELHEKLTRVWRYPHSSCAFFSHLACLGLSVNMQKTKLQFSQSITFLGMILDSCSMNVQLSAERVQTIFNALTIFCQDRDVPLKTFQRLLGLMVASASVCHFGFALYEATTALAERLHSTERVDRRENACTVISCLLGSTGTCSSRGSLWAGWSDGK